MKKLTVRAAISVSICGALSAGQLRELDIPCVNMAL
jgi:hypothetical protein